MPRCGAGRIACMRSRLMVCSPTAFGEMPGAPRAGEG
mgnify:CR=1 FL=1